MKRHPFTILFLCLFSIMAAPSLSCAGSPKNPQAATCLNFMHDLDAKNLDKVMAYMDSSVMKLASDSAWAREVARIYVKLKKDYTGKLRFICVDSQKTTREEQPVEFVLVRIESDNRFGYYGFLVNSRTNKVIVVQVTMEAQPR